MNKNYLSCALGLAVAISFGGATASAQATSDKRIPIRKDVAAAPAAAVTKTDTVQLAGRVDTVVVAGPVRTVTVQHYDTTTVVQVQQMKVHRLPDLYYGLGAGVPIPMNSWRNSTKEGPAVQGMLGWFPHDGALGLRADVTGSFLSHRATDCPLCPDPSIYAGNADVVLRLPLDRTSYLNPVVYFLGGAGAAKINNFIPYKNTDGQIVTGGDNTYLNEPGFVITPAGAGTASWFLNVEAGAGLDFNAGPAHMYLETKYSTLGTTNGGSHYWPTIIGFKFF
jgi:hypothetical protein